MQKKIGYEIVIEVDGFDDARRWIYRCIDAGIVKCGQCDNPATHVFWQDRAEWYCRCGNHREYGDQWTGSTRWNPASFGLNVLLDAAKTWYAALPDEDRAKVKRRKYDATDYYAHMVKDWNARTEHYFRGSASEMGYRLYAVVTPLTNGEYVYELHNDHMHAAGGFMRAYGVYGAWSSAEEAVEAARQAAVKRRLLTE